MARGRSRYQKGRVVSTEAGGWEIHYNVYLTDPKTGRPRRHHRSRVVGYPPKMRKAEAESILAAELASVNGGPVARVADGTITFGEWMRNFYIPMRGANWREATRRSNDGYLKKQIYPRLEYVALKDISKFQVQMLLNQLAAEGYSYNVVYHVRDIIKAALAEALDQDVLERNVARKTVIPEIEEREKPVLPVEWYAKLLGGLETARDRAILLIACFCALRPSELFGLTWDSYQGNVFVIANTAWRGRLQRKKIKRKNRFGQTNFRLVAIPAAVVWAIEQCAGTMSRRSSRCPDVSRNPSPRSGHARNPYVPRQLAAPAPLSGCEEAGHPVSPDISGPAPELFHPRQERGASHRNAGTTGPQRRQNNPEHLHPDRWSGSDPNGE
jgi:integrase